jgi:hypothetical protein
VAALLTPRRDTDAGARSTTRSAPAAIALAAREGAYADRLLASLERARAAGARGATRRAGDLLHRRPLGGPAPPPGSLGRYETLGFAGFFAVAMSYRALGSRRADAQAPVLLDPRYAVAEVPSGPGGDRFLESHRALAGAEHGLHRAKDGVASPFALAESAGGRPGRWRPRRRSPAARTCGSGREPGRRRHRPRPRSSTWTRRSGPASRWRSRTPR